MSFQECNLEINYGQFICENVDVCECIISTLSRARIVYARAHINVRMENTLAQMRVRIAIRTRMYERIDYIKKSPLMFGIPFYFIFSGRRHRCGRSRKKKKTYEL